METIEKLNLLVSKCHGDIRLAWNDHKSCFVEPSEYFFNGNDPSPEVLAEMIKLNRIIELQFYPVSTVGFYLIYHHDLDALLDMALSCFKTNEEKNNGH